MRSEPLKLHLGCGNNLKSGYINIDAYVEHPDVYRYDILDLPFEDASVSEILAEHLFEHIGFEHEEKLFRECHRLLISDGILIVETPDMEWLCETFGRAKDDFKAFYRLGAVDHYWGSGRAIDQRWGMILTHIFGNQNGPGQFHKNAYTQQKFHAIARLIGFSNCHTEIFMSPKGAQAIRATLTK